MDHDWTEPGRTNSMKNICKRCGVVGFFLKDGRWGAFRTSPRKESPLSVLVGDDTVVARVPDCYGKSCGRSLRNSEVRSRMDHRWIETSGRIRCEDCGSFGFLHGETGDVAYRKSADFDIPSRAG